MTDRSSMLPTKQRKDVDQGSSIPLLTPKLKTKNDLGSAKEAIKVNISRENQIPNHTLRDRPRKQEPLSGLNHQGLSLHRQSEIHAIQPTGSLSKKNSIPKPGIPLSGGRKSSANSQNFTSGYGALRSQSISSDGASLLRLRGRTGSGVPAVNSHVDLQKHGQYRSQMIPNRSISKQTRVLGKGVTDDGLLQASRMSQHTTSAVSSRSAASMSGPNETLSDCSEALPEEHRHIQIELLRLHILHSTSATIQSQWRTSAKTHFHKRFSLLKERHTEIADISYQTQQLKNRSALVDWCRNAQASEVGERIHILSGSIHEVYDDQGLGGKYSFTVESFQAWYNRAQEVRETRKLDIMPDIAHVRYVEAIGTVWQNDVNILQRRLSTMTGDLRTLGSARASSSLGKILVLLQDLVIDMLTELDCMRSIESELVAQEKLWFEEEVTTLSSKVDNEKRRAKASRGPGPARSRDMVEL
ncbi:MAG: hypothetical protein Q9172_001794 [Xanthocarpia lactea]